MDTKITCSCGHCFELSLPYSAFDRGPLVPPCPKCNKRYIVYEDGHSESFEREPLRFLAMHN